MSVRNKTKDSQFSKANQPKARPEKSHKKGLRHPVGQGSRYPKNKVEVFGQKEASARIYDIFRHHGFADYSHDKREQLVQFYLKLIEHQMTTDNVTRLVKLRDVAIKHFIDSLMIPRLTNLCFPLLDVGTGAGFPGIPLKIDFPDERILLAEGVQKRVTFLKRMREEFQFKNLDIFGRYIDPDFEYPVQGVITRAVEDLNQTLRNVSQSLQVGGRAFLMKGPQVDNELNRGNWASFYRLVEDHSYELPKTPHQRRLLVFEKIKTPLKSELATWS